jgi:hypothetical protein
MLGSVWAGWVELYKRTATCLQFYAVTGDAIGTTHMEWAKYICNDLES